MRASALSRLDDMSSEPAGPDTPSLQDLLGLGRSRSRWRAWAPWLLALLLATLAGLGIAWWYGNEREAAAPRFVTARVERGSLVATVAATGNLQPTNKVDVGSELSGTIEAVLVDDNDRVKKGQVLARLDRSKLRDQAAKSRAAATATEAKVLQTQASVEQARSNLGRLREVARLSGGKVPAPAELDTAEANLARAQADEAAARAAVAEARAVLSADETNLTKALIRSPIDGVVLMRRVEPGQTVAASFQAPVLFTLAENLSQMELQVDVDEADVGQVKAGQSATFSVDAYPGRAYPARIDRVGFGSQVKEGVVSYLTVLSVDNADLTLRPGMTATAEIVTAARENVLLVPNAALRFTPPARAAANDKKSSGIVGSLLPGPPRQPARKAMPAATPGAERVWVLRAGEPVAVPVKTGVTNGRVTEVVSGELEAGTEVIVEALASRG
ncbi:MAG: efflux RND transporter periplasmic adaptor subunit [Burkholderiales bacterium]|nr:efflux RND transporter periplasmic adaptor subunit [Burkholderiales bacterium]